MKPLTREERLGLHRLVDEARRARLGTASGYRFCANENCSQEFYPHHSRQRYCSTRCRQARFERLKLRALRATPEGRAAHAAEKRATFERQRRGLWGPQA